MFFVGLNSLNAQNVPTKAQTDSVASDTLIYPFVNTKTGGLYLNNPKNAKETVDYDTKSNSYIFTNKIGEYNISNPYLMNRKEYSDYVLNKSMQEYFKQKSDALDPKKKKQSGSDNLLPQFTIDSKFFETIFGGNTIEIIPQGYASIDLGMLYQNIDNPQIPEENRSNLNFNFDQRIQLSVIGKIGKKLRLQTNYDTQATFNFQNQMKLEFTGNEDDIVKKIELGNVSLPVNSSLIQGAQSLFGVKTKLQFGKTTVTGVFSEQKSQTKTITSEGGSTVNEFEFYIDNYEANKHYYFSQYFFDNYDVAVKDYPFINSGINITRIEVWTTNRKAETENVRNIVGMMDLGESNPYNPNVTPSGSPFPDNESNSLNPASLPAGVRDISQVPSAMSSIGLNESSDYVVLENARKLTPNEFKFDPRLGYISLNQSLNADEVLGIAFQYTYNGKTYQVGEFSNDGIEAPQNIVVKLLKSTITDVKLPTWDLMMKNIYAMGAYQVSPDDFRLDILYANDKTGVPLNYLDDSPVKDQILLTVFNLDRLNKNGDPQPDGYFDFLNGITIDSKNGKIIFPAAQPFGKYLENKLAGDAAAIDKYVFQELYDSTKFVAQQQTRKNKFLLKGKYKAEGGGGIPLGAINVPRGSVKVTSGGRTLVEGVDYTVDYQLGRVKVINENLTASGAPVSVSLENNSAFSLQTRRFMGLNIEHKFNDKFVMEANILNLKEKPLTQKVSYGVEPVNNTVFGASATFSDEAPYLSDFASMISFADRKVKSNISVTGEFAYLMPGSPSGIDVTGGSTSYIDDFESAQITMDIKSVSQWQLASTPNDPTLFPEASIEGIGNGINRARFSWYIIDPLFYGSSAITPKHIQDDKDQLSQNSVRRVYINEVFPETEVPIGSPTIIPMFDLAYYPQERGMYNFDDTNINPDGTLQKPEDRWGGITRALTTSNFEESNIEYIQIWMMDPFAEDPNNTGGDLYFNLGSISEDILRDGRKSFENGIPADGNTNDLIETEWGLVPKNQSLLYSFDNNDDAVLVQDIGFNGMNSTKEASFYSAYMNKITGIVTDANALADINNDPATDDFHHFRGTDFDNNQVSILSRYKNYNGVEGNSKPASKSPESYPTASTTLPDVEDLNKDQSLSRTESYFQYKLKLDPTNMEIGESYIVDKKESSVLLANGKRKPVIWYQFKIPLSQPEKTIGGIADFRSIRFIRMFMHGFKDSTVVRMAKLEFIRGEWRRYNKMFDDDEDLDFGMTGTKYEVSAVNLEENSNRTPIPYVTPPGIDREKLFNQTQVQQQNEQSLSFIVDSLAPGESRSAFKNISVDLRRYKTLKMFAHLESREHSAAVTDGELKLVVRMGSDFGDNYYQYSIPLKVTPWGARIDTDIWPSENELNLDFTKWEDIKLERNSNNSDRTKLFERPDGKNFVAVKGNPSMANIRSIVIGLESSDNTIGARSAELWVNELRLTGFDERGGWAAAATVNANFADLADVSFSGSMSTIGFGSLEKGVSERANEDVKRYDLATNVNLGKFAPQRWGLNIPMYYTQTETFKDPEYNPLNPDITLQKSLENVSSESDKQKLLKIAQDHTKRTSVSFTNVRKERKGKKKPKIYDVENLSVSYSQSKTEHTDVNTEYFIDNTYKAGIQYNFNSKPKNYKPFKNWKFAKSSEWLNLVENTNVYLFPSKLSFQTDMSRRYNTEKYRNIESPQLKIDPLYNKNFMMNYAYSFTFDLTKNLKIDLSTRANNIVDEPFGAIDTGEKRDTIWTNVMSFGRPTHFHQRFNIGYKLPLQDIPALKWIDVNFKYSADFDWQAGSLANRTEDLNLGNNLQNSNTVQLNGKLNFKKLYSQLGIGKKSSSKNRKSRKPGAKTTAKPTSSAWDIPVGILTMIKDVTMSYSENNGTFLPGYLPEVGFFGQQNYNGRMAPSLGFMFGDQTDIRQTAVLNGWLTTDTKLNTPYTETHVEKISFKSTLEPLPELRIDLTASRNYAISHSEFYRYVKTDVPQEGFYSQNPYQNGNFNITFFTLLTSFSKSEEYESKTFNSLRANRQVVSNRLATDYYGDNPIPVDPETGYAKGYGPNSQQVLIPSFLAAYSGQDASSITMSATRDIPIPNWNVTYNGLMRIGWFKTNFKNFTIAHGYRSAYSINSFTTNLQYSPDSDITDKSGNFIGEFIYSNINMIEAFSPLIRVDMDLNNNMSFKSEIKKDRTVNLSMDNNMVTEILGDEYVVGFGYRIKDLKFIIRSKGRRRTIKSDLNLKVDVSYRKNRTFIRNLSEDNTQVTGGQNMTSIKASADYALSKRLTLKLYYDQNLTKYALSTAFPTSNTRFGFSMRFNLGN